MTTENAKDNGDFAAIERAAHKAWMDSKHMESSDPYCCFIDGFHAGRSQPSEWVARVPVEAITAALPLMEERLRFLDSYFYTKDAETLRKHIASLRALLPSPPESLMPKTEAK